MRFIGHYREYTHETHKYISTEAEAKSMNIHVNMLLSHCGHLLMFPQIKTMAILYLKKNTHTFCTVDLLINVDLYKLAIILDATRLYETHNSYCIYV